MPYMVVENESGYHFRFFSTKVEGSAYYKQSDIKHTDGNCLYHDVALK